MSLDMVSRWRWMAAIAFAANLTLLGCDADVAEPERRVALVQVSPQPAEVELERSLQLEAVLLDPAGNPVSVARIFWASEDTMIARVDSNGVVTGRARGTTRIAASSTGVSGTTTVIIVPQRVGTVQLSPSITTLVVGAQQQLTATARSSDGSALTGREVLWSSSNTGVLRVTESGLLTAIAPGTSRVSAVVEGVTAAMEIAVAPAPVASVEVSPSSAQLSTGENRQFTATPRSAGGQALQGRAVIWSTDAPTVVRVSSSGLVTALAPGQATVTASSEGRSGSASITVTALPAPANLVIVSGNRQEGNNHETLEEPLVVRVLDAAGRALAGVVVTWTTDSGRITETSITDSGGEATARWTLGPGGRGERSAWAEVGGGLKVEFTARR